MHIARLQKPSQTQDALKELDTSSIFVCISEPLQRCSVLNSQTVRAPWRVAQPRIVLLSAVWNKIYAADKPKIEKVSDGESGSRFELQNVPESGKERLVALFQVCR